MTTTPQPAPGVHPLHDILPRPANAKDPSVVNALIEIPEGSKIKYEVDKETGLLFVDRVLYSSTLYPNNYGFIPRTLCDDGDALVRTLSCAAGSTACGLRRGAPEPAGLSDLHHDHHRRPHSCARETTLSARCFVPRPRAARHARPGCATHAAATNRKHAAPPSSQAHPLDSTLSATRAARRTSSC